MAYAVLLLTGFGVGCLSERLRVWPALAILFSIFGILCLKWLVRNGWPGLLDSAFVSAVTGYMLTMILGLIPGGLLSEHKGYNPFQ